jgi:hypothetical protein
MMQEIIGDTLETLLFKQLVEHKFGEGLEVPKVKWKPIWEPNLTDKAKLIGDLIDRAIIDRDEARAQLGYPVAAGENEIVENPPSAKHQLQGLNARKKRKRWLIAEAD